MSFATAACRVGYHAISDIGNVRKTNEDTFVIETTLPVVSNDIAAARALVAVFDGHGGRRAADFLQQHFVQFFTDDAAYGYDTAEALRSTCRRIDAAFLDVAVAAGSVNDGSTAIVTVLEHLHGQATPRATTANVGDSRAILCRADISPEPLSKDQVAARDDEALRVYTSGGFVAYKNKFRAHSRHLTGMRRPMREAHEAWMQSLGRPLRVYPGGVMCSRSIGDLNCKEAKVLICDPEISQVQLAPHHTCLIVASDGLWGVVTNKKAQAKARAVLRDLAQNDSSAQAAGVSKALAKLAKGQLESDDNITVAVAVFGWLDNVELIE
ncbi:hypothetical protein ACHHYP_01084 [Achlya hypogyna]|uniref:PPM-type phosphatase domain-containing protein n=1 Tax=Achlya hypogyna TaxID=1202772 RepID=A0A1V9ZTT3_ACHHY|nr:hypothetical protein ACHHYP_01084 [Achlya hypogyna]